jgi:hypothetical protein
MVGSAAALMISFFAVSAQTGLLILDDFSETQSITSGVGENDTAASSIGLLTGPFSTRTLDVSRNLLGSGNAITANINSPSGALSFQNGNDAAATLTLLYDVVGLADFTNGGVNDAFVLNTTSLDSSMSFSVDLTSEGGGVATAI